MKQALDVKIKYCNAQIKNMEGPWLWIDIKTISITICWEEISVGAPWVGFVFND